MLISVVVPFFNAQYTITLCLEALASQQHLPHEIILVDNRSSDNSLEIARSFQQEHPELKIELFEEHTPGPSAARNRGIREANGEVIAFTDSDCIPDVYWLQKIEGASVGTSTGAVAGRITGLSPESAINKFHAMFTMKGFPEPQIFTEFTLLRGGFPTANLSVKKDLLDSIKGFDETLKIYSEDYDLCARIYKAGFSIRYEPDAVVYHKHRNTLKGTWKQSFGFGTGHAVLLKKHFNKLLMIDFPKYQYISKRWPIRAWLDLTGADKKLLGFFILFLIWLPAGCLIPAYLLYLFFVMHKHLKLNHLSARFIEKWQMIFLLIFKSTALTTGRIIGSIQNRVFCI